MYIDRTFQGILDVTRTILVQAQLLVVHGRRDAAGQLKPLQLSDAEHSANVPPRVQRKTDLRWERLR